jgi:hypothetical protein
MTQLSNPSTLRVRLAADGVVANYIHDISARTTPRPRPRRADNHGREARIRHARAALRGASAERERVARSA